MQKVEFNTGHIKPQTSLQRLLLTRGPWVLVVLTIASLCFTVKLFLTPLSTEEKVVVNKVKQYADFTSSATVRPSALYPLGGNIGVRKKFFTNIVNIVNIRIITKLTSEKPLSLTGESKVLLTLKADDLWEKEFIIQPPKEFSCSDKTDIPVINGVYPVNIHQIIAYIDQVEKEIKSSPAEYSLLINPVVKGVSLDKRTKIYYSPIYTVKFSKIQIKTDGHSSEEKELLIEDVKKKNASLGFGGVMVPLKPAKYVFLAMSILLSIITAWRLKGRQTTSRARDLEDTLNKKYGHRIVAGCLEGLSSNSITVKLSTFKELIKIADEQEKPIIFAAKKGSDDRQRAAYYVIDCSVVYVYELT